MAEQKVFINLVNLGKKSHITINFIFCKWQKYETSTEFKI
jgi:hypothetical protein